MKGPKNMKRIIALLICLSVVAGGLVVPTVAAEGSCANGHTPMHSEATDPLCDAPGLTEGTYCAVCGITLSGREETAPALGHNIEQVEAKKATYTGVGWNAYEACTRCPYSTRVEVPILSVPNVDDYSTFLYYLAALEALAGDYINENPGKDPLNLIIKYIRTGVERYNSGSWGIMAGYEDADFAKYAAMMEDMVNSNPEYDLAPEDMLAICSLKNLNNFALPNGEIADLGHMFGTMDITYHNNFGINHADVAGWAGDLVDLLEFADVSKVNGTLEEMVAEISQNYLGKTPQQQGQSGFSYTDIIGDLDAYYIMKQLQTLEYAPGALSALIGEYFTEDLAIEDRADYFLRNRLDGASTRSEIREAVYNAYINNKVVATLEGTREFSSANLDDLKKACCYAFADYLCKLAGDYVEDTDRSYFTVFSSESSVLAPGVKQEIKYATTADGEQTKFYLATADITRADVHVFANYKDNNPAGGWGLQRLLEQANAAQKKYGDPASEHYRPNYSVIASINGAGFNMSTGEPGGLLVMGGVEYCKIDNGGFFGILDDGTAVIGTTEEYNTIYKGHVQEGIAGFGAVLIKDGEIVVPHSDTYMNDRASRTAIGITRTGKVVFMVMDGRQKGAGACGGSMQEIAQVLLEAGCVNAVNLDGGGSTTYVAKPEGEDELKVVNSPSDGIQRSVSASLMIVSTAPDSTAFDHALIDSPVDYMTQGATIQMTATGVSATGNPAELPQNTYWSVSDSRFAAITADGKLTALRGYGSVDVNLECEGVVIGSKTIEFVTPENIYFTKSNINAVYGEQIVLPVKVLYNHKEVAFTENDVTFILSNNEAGTINGMVFTASTTTNVKVVQITAALNGTDKAATISVSLYEQGTLSFDFDQATGGNRQLAWDRKVTNSTTDDQLVYTVVDNSEPMVTSYTLALDMSQIPIPKKLEELTYMLPGSDMEGASAWMFLCNLAERISSMTVVTPTVRFDPNVEVDYSNLNLINDYFTLEAVDMDEATNTLSLTLRWKKVYNAIDVSTANPLCLVNGIRLTPKDGAAWSEQNRLNIANSGEIGYTIYLRASSLVTFANKPENQEIFGLYPYHNPADQADAGAYFSSIYAEFEDSYTLVNSMKSGWILGDTGYSYYVDGVKLTGMQKIGELYYNLGEDGVNLGRTPYTGIFEIGGKYYCARDGALLTEGWYTIGEKDYHIHKDNSLHESIVDSTQEECTLSYSITKTCTACSDVDKSEGIYPKGHDWTIDYVCKICGTVGKDIADAQSGFGNIGGPKTQEYFYQDGGLRPSFYVTFDGTNKLTYSNDNNLIGGYMRDLFISWNNDRGIGKATMNIEGRGDYYGNITLTYTIVPNDVKNLKATATYDSITLTWDKALGAGYYKLYKYDKATQNRTLIDGNITGTSYTITGLEADTEYSYIMRSAAMSTDGEDKEYTRLSGSLTVRTTPMPDSTELIKAAVIATNGNIVKMLRVDGAVYFILPADTDNTKLNLALSLNQNAPNNVIVSGDLGKVTGTASGISLDLTKLASKNADGSYTIGIAVGEYRPISVKILKSENISSMFITSDNPAQDRIYVDSSKNNETTAQMILTGANGTVLYNGNLTQIKARGNSTFAHYAKKSYQIKLGEKSDLIGQNQTVKTWVLLANYGDATLMHDKFFKDLAAQMNMPYVAGCNWVNLWYDGEYRGVYLLSEKNSVGSTGVNITNMEDAYSALNPGYGTSVQIGQGVNKYGQAYAYTMGLTDPENITGGYLIELNHSAWDEVNGFKTKQGVAFNVKSPEWASEAAMKYISEYYQEFENAVYATDKDGNYTGYNAETGKYFYEYVDMDSLVKVFLLQELALNPDGFISSMYFYKDANGLMYAGPIWDQDMTLGTGWTKYLNSSIVDYHYLAKALIQIPAFKNRVNEYFVKEFAPMIRSTLTEGGTIDRYYALLAENAELNYILWPYVRVGDPTNANHIWVNADYASVVNDMRTWLSARLTVLENLYAPKYALGDANQDGEMNSRDAVDILRKLAGYKIDGFNDTSADFNGDGEVNSRDAVDILRKLAGY